MDIKNAKKMIREVDKARDNYRLRYTKGLESIFDSYDLMIDTSKYGADKTADILADIVESTFL